MTAVPDTSERLALPTVPAGAPGWVTPELLAETIDAWQPRYEHSLTANDALEILSSVTHLFDVLKKVEQADDETISGTG